MPILGIMASQISGHLWAPAGAYDSLATVTVGTAVSSITFAGIPSGYKHLQIRIFGASTTSGTSVNDMFYQFNGDTGSNYSTHYLLGQGTGAFSAGFASQTRIRASNVLPYAGATNIFGASIIDILDYSSTSKAKTARSLSGTDFNGSGYLTIDSGAWYNSSTAINSIVFTSGANNIAQYSSFALYGSK